MSDIRIYGKGALITVFSQKEIAIDITDIDLNNLFGQLDKKEVMDYFRLVEPEENNEQRD